MLKRLLITLFIVGCGLIISAQSETTGQLGLNGYKPTILIKMDTSYFIADTIKLKKADVKWFRKRYYLMKPVKYKILFDAPLNETAVVLTLKRRYYDKLLDLK
jgi:hypothetical protein